MGKKDETNVANRAWNVLRLALISARKGGVLRRRLLTDLRLVPKFIKSLRPASAATSSSHQQQIGNFYGERQFSFEKTPLFDFKMHHHSPAASLRFIFPCIVPSCPADSFDFDDCDYLHKQCTVDDDVEEEFEEQSEEESSFDSSSEEDYDEEESEGVDSRADKFIAQFYQQMKLQRQISYLEYHK